MAASNFFDGVSGEPLLAVEIAASGSYTIEVSGHTIDASPAHYYRLTVGALPYVTSCFPLSVPASSESDVQLNGFNLGSNVSVKVKSGADGEVLVPVDPNRHRSRHDSFSLLVSPWLASAELVETEPNNDCRSANTLSVPGAANGRIETPEGVDGVDVDFYSFEAKKGQRLIIET